LNPHKLICPKLSSFKSWRNVRRYLKFFGMTRGEQKKVLEFCEWKLIVGR